MKLKFNRITEPSYYGKMMTFSQRSFAGGINYSMLPTGIDFSKELKDCKNVFVGLDNLLRVRYGTTEFYDSGEDTDIQGIGYYDNQIAYAANGKVFLGNTQIGTCSTGAKVSFLNYKGNLYILDGSTLKRYDGTIYGDVPNAPKCNHGVVHHNRLWVVGDPDNPSRLWISGVNDDEDWGSSGYQLGSYIDIDPFEDAKITGIGLYFDSVILFKNGAVPRIYRVDGFPMVLDSEMYQAANPLTVTTLLDNNSCINPHTVCMTSIGMAFMARDGIYILDAQKGGLTMISHNINQELMLGSFDHENAVATYYPHYGLYIVCADDTAYVYNVYSKGWFKWEFDVYNVTHVGVVENNLAFGTDDGRIFYWDSTSAQDDGQDITAVIETGYYEFDSTSIAKYVSEAYLVIDLPTSGDVYVTFKPNYSNIYGIDAQILYDIDKTTIKQSLGDMGGVSNYEKKFKLVSIIGDAGFDDPNFGFDTSTIIGFDGYVGKPQMHKMGVNARCTNIGVEIEIVGTLASIQQLDLVFYPIAKTP